MRLFTQLLIAGVVLTAGPLCLADDVMKEAERIAAAVAPVIDEQAVAVVHLDYAKLNADASLTMILGLVGVAAPPEVMEKIASIQALQEAGMNEAFVVFSLAELPHDPLSVYVPLAEGADREAATAALKSLVAVSHLEVSRFAQGLLATRATMRKRLESNPADARGNLAAAFAVVADEPLQVVFSPPEHFRPVIEQTLTRLPPEIGGGPSTILTKGVEWAALGIALVPKPTVRLVVQSESQEAAEGLLAALEAGREALLANGGFQRDVPNGEAVVALLKPTVEGDRLVLVLDTENGKLPKLIQALRGS
jgi:hypothetical protein